MKFGYAILHVNSVTDTVAFYERAFGLSRGMVVPTGDYGEMVTGETKLAFAQIDFVKTLTPVPIDTAAPGKPAPPVAIALVTDQVSAAYEHAIAVGAVAVKAPEKKPWGQYVGYVRDINGFMVEICSPIG